MDTKKCTKCGEVKPVEEFSKRHCKDGRIKLRSHCRVCVRGYSKRNWDKNKDKLEEIAKRYRIKSRDKIRQRQKQRVANFADVYLRAAINILSKKLTGVRLKSEDITPAMIEAKRLQMKLKRKIKEVSDGIIRTTA